MRHLRKGKTLGREKAPRVALMRGLATNLVIYEKIKTTQAKAKALRPKVEKLITISKANTLASRRQLLRVLYTEGAVKKMLEVIGPRFKDRKGGYTRIVKLQARQQDGADMAIIELV